MLWSFEHTLSLSLATTGRMMAPRFKGCFILEPCALYAEFQLFGQLFVKEPRYIPSFTIDLTPTHSSYSPNTNSQKPKPRQSLILTFFLKTQNRLSSQKSNTHLTCFLPLKIMRFEFWNHMSKLYF